MSRSALALPLALLLPLATAAPAAVGDFGSLEEFARAVAMKQGAWRTRITVTAVDFKPSPDADPAELARTRAVMKSRLGKVQERNECLGAQPGEGLRLPGVVIDPDFCSFSRMHATDGRWTLDSNCGNPANDESATLRGEGTYSPTWVNGTHEGRASLKGVVIHMKARFESRHVGECSAPRPFDPDLEKG